MKIAFVGDSYCADVIDIEGTNISWLDLVSKEYNADILCIGRGGRALFHAYEDLLKIVNKADYIIFCITTYSRLPNRFGIPLDYNWVVENEDSLSAKWSIDKSIKNDQALEPELRQTKYHHYHSEHTNRHHMKAIKAGELYYKDLISFDFHQIAQKGILMQMDELMLQKKKKCIWFPCFEDDLSMQEYIPKSGPISSHDLSSISNCEPAEENSPLLLIALKHDQQDIKGRPQLDPLKYPDGSSRLSPDARMNHLNNENNQNMANLIIDIIDSDDFTPRKLDMRKYFDVLKWHTTGDFPP